MLSDKGQAVTGGDHAAEIVKIQAASQFFSELDRMGKLKVVPRDSVETEASRISSRCKSNDTHIIAIARISGARTIWTDDKALMRDWRDGSLLKSPRGRVFSKVDHVHLLGHTPGCGGGK
ncbi:MAG: PIN domain-containing protein [Phycisphaeraceae bacterium]|nr:PIN domain-containing protein [Phycisphaeraceae bacterium]